MTQRFHDVHISRAGRYTLGKDQETGSWFLSIPVANRMVDYEEYYRLDEVEYDEFRSNEAAAMAFAELCRARQKDGRLILPPGAERGTAL